MCALENLIKIAISFGDKPIINVDRFGKLGVYTDDSGITEWAKLSQADKKMRQSQLLSYLRSGQSFWLGAYIGHLELKVTSQQFNW